MYEPAYRTRTFNPARGGHAPCHLREALYFWIMDDSLGTTFDYGGEEFSIHRLTGALWNCTDVLPSLTAQLCEDRWPCGREPSTVARAVRRIRDDLDDAE